MQPMIEVTGLRKSYGKVQAVKGLDFTVERGKLFAFLGPNGAGKSTTIDMICTFLRPDAGRVVVDGHVLGEADDAIRACIGVVFQDGVLDALLSVRENLRARAAFYGIKGAALTKAIDFAAQATDLVPLLDRPYGKLSGGQRRRADIARALVNAPKILFLDEPTTGLDPQTRQSVWQTIRRIQRQTDMTVFLTTHYMEEAAEADRVIVIDDGRIVARGTPAELKERYTDDLLLLTPRSPQALAEALAGAGVAHERRGGQIVIRLRRTMDALPILKRYEAMLLGFEVHSGTMDDAFIGITGKEIRE